MREIKPVISVRVVTDGFARFVTFGRRMFGKSKINKAQRLFDLMIRVDGFTHPPPA
jgi:hypothetical protein